MILMQSKNGKWKQISEADFTLLPKGFMHISLNNLLSIILHIFKVWENVILQMGKQE